ncbi:hypothetical protein QQ045_023264 [Rhodiola kirilowii]
MSHHSATLLQHLMKAKCRMCRSFLRAAVIPSLTSNFLLVTSHTVHQINGILQIQSICPVNPPVRRSARARKISVRFDFQAKLANSGFFIGTWDLLRLQYLIIFPRERHRTNPQCKSCLPTTTEVSYISFLILDDIFKIV